MMNILFIPLDERPCNRKFPELIIASEKDVKIISPKPHLLGDKKVPAQVSKLWDFIFENAKSCSYAVLSIDMLIYGGLIPSRIHHLTKNEAEENIKNLKRIKEINPNIKIFAFNCIMRAPQYNSSEEEPDYYDEYGYDLFRSKYLIDKKLRVGINKAEEEELDLIKIPKEVLLDYESRREFNEYINIEVAKLLEDETLDFLVIPQDDSSEYGYTSISQKRVLNFIKEKKLEFKSSVYPGADEVGNSLLARGLNNYLNRVVKIYAFYSSTLGPSIIPLYEDRPMNESLKYHVRVCGGELVDNPEDADLILAINSPGKNMQEASEQLLNIDLTYTSHRNLLDFVYKIEKHINEGRKVILSDSAFANGGDLTLIDYLDRLGLFQKLTAYAGWNTNCNTLGTVISSGVYSLNSNNKNQMKHLIYRLIEDVLYQSKIRMKVIKDFLPVNGLSYYDFKNKQQDVENVIKKLLLEEYNKLNLSKIFSVNIKSVTTPWNRMFEIGMEMDITNSNKDL